MSEGSPPHVRVIRLREKLIHPLPGITPACAGNTLAIKYLVELL